MMGVTWVIRTVPMAGYKVEVGKGLEMEHNQGGTRRTTN